VFRVTRPILGIHLVLAQIIPLLY